jgi:hypothetical protein
LKFSLKLMLALFWTDVGCAMCIKPSLNAISPLNKLPPSPSLM